MAYIAKTEVDKQGEEILFKQKEDNFCPRMFFVERFTHFDTVPPSRSLVPLFLGQNWAFYLNTGNVEGDKSYLKGEIELFLFFVKPD